MNPTLVLEFVELALSLRKGAGWAQILVQIIQKALQTYKDQTGKPLDPSLIKPEGTI
jgi:hypothetical protein